MIDVDQLKAARAPHEIFGKVTNLVELHAVFKELARRFHPDKLGGAGDAMAILNAMRDRGEEQLVAGTYGRAATAVIALSREYRILGKLADGDLCVVYQAEYGDTGRALVKVARDPRDRDLVENEAKVLTELWADKSDSGRHFCRYLPALLESGRIKVGGKLRAVNVFDATERGITLAEMMKWPGPLDPRHAVWLWKRVVELLGWVHDKGIVHGAIFPEHILVTPQNHGVRLIDWTCSGKGKVGAVVTRRMGMYPPELLDKKREAEPAADLYMAAMSIRSAFGNMPTLLMNLFRACTLTSPLARFNDANDFLQVLKETASRQYGPPKFVELKTP